MKRPAPRAVAFDLDDTLWPCDEVVDRAERIVYAWLEHHCPRITAEHDLEQMRSLRNETARRRPELSHDLTRLRHHTLTRHARQAGYPDAIADTAVEVFLAERNRVLLYDDVIPVLAHLRGRVPLVALTNGNADIGRVGLGDYFDVALTAADVGAAKPDPAMFRVACAELNIRPGDLMHVGDDPLRDVHAARSIGARAVWVNRTGSAWPEELRPPDHELADLDGLLRWFGGPGDDG